ncbi:MAG: dihydroneopterin aldolase [Bacteroidota bacterium]|jgi:dihydroneopterin aldolase
MKNLIEVSGIKLYCFHGCLEEESRIGGHYRVNIKLETDFTLAAQNDDLSQTIDYVTVNEIVESEMQIPAKLIEHVGQRIYLRIKSTFSSCLKLEVEIVKLSPPINGDVDSVAITISDFY